MSEIAKQIGENIRQLRKQRGLSQEQLALHAEINPSYMGQVERGEKNPTIDVLSKISQALDLPLEQLVHTGANEEPGAADGEDEEGYAYKIAHQIKGLTLKDQESAYRLIKEFVRAIK
jgi:transcriptional regulator with XRE-family HTH domain